MEVSFALVREAYISEIVGEHGRRSIRVRALNGPFRYLRALWQFKELPDGGAEVTFNMNYEFENPVIALTVGRFFDKAFRHLV